jgi:2-polyprenyl-3-methyl-5-hydroxy-6-metoxy-1,4-benzoquinol methylase
MSYLSSHSSYKQHSGLLSPWVDNMRIRKIVPHIPEDSKILDIGCAGGLLLSAIPKGCAYIGADLDPQVINENRKRFPEVQFDCFDVCQKPFPYKDRQFDAVVMAAFLEHIENTSHLFKEVSRVLKTGGCAIITTPSRIGGRVHAIMARLGLLSLHAAEEHKDFFELEEVRNMLLSSGLKIYLYKRFQFGFNQIFIVRHETQ